MKQAPSGLEPLIGRLLVKAGPEILTTRPLNYLYLRCDFILMCFGNRVKAKEIQLLSFSREIRPFWKKFLYHQLPNMIHDHAKFAPLDFINKKKMIGKRRSFFFTQTEHPLCNTHNFHT